jgi:hypothetical protein
MDKLNQIRKTNKEYRFETIRILKLEQNLYLDKIQLIENWIGINEDLIRNNY